MGKKKWNNGGRKNKGKLQRKPGACDNPVLEPARESQRRRQARTKTGICRQCPHGLR